MFNWEYISKLEQHAHKHLKNAIKEFGEPEIEFSSWVINSAPQPPTCPTMPRRSNVFMWHDTMSGNWCLFCGCYWKWGKHEKLPFVGDDLHHVQWHRFGI